MKLIAIISIVIVCTALAAEAVPVIDYEPENHMLTDPCYVLNNCGNDFAFAMYAASPFFMLSIASAEYWIARISP